MRLRVGKPSRKIRLRSLELTRKKYGILEGRDKIYYRRERSIIVKKVGGKKKKKKINRKEKGLIKERK